MKRRILSVLLAGAITLQAGMVTVFAQTSSGEGTPGESLSAQPDRVSEAERLIAVLPDASELKEMDEEALQAAREQIEAACEAYEALSEEERAQLTGADALLAELLDALSGESSTMANYLDYTVQGNLVRFEPKTGTIIRCDLRALSLDIPDNFDGIKVTSIGVAAFTQCKDIERITIPEGVTSIEMAAFSNCRKLRSITIPESVTYIGDNAFDACTSLISINIPNGMTEICQGTFSDCTGLINIAIPDSVTTIKENAFSGCTSLKSVTIPNGTEQIYPYTFSNCTSLTNITIPNSVKEIKEGAFSGCTNLTVIYYTGTKEEWDKVEKNDAGIPENVVIYCQSPNPVPEKSSYVRFLKSYDTATDQAFFGDGLLADVPAADVDMSFKNDLDKLVGRYVLVEPGEGLTFKSIRPVESKLGTISDYQQNGTYISTITFDGRIYPVSRGFIGYEDMKGSLAICHFSEGTIVGFEVLEKASGILSACGNDYVTIDDTRYATNYLTDLSSLASADQLFGTQVDFYHTSSPFSPFIMKIDSYMTMTGTCRFYDSTNNTLHIDNDSYPVDLEKCKPNNTELMGEEVFFLLSNGTVVHIDCMDKLSSGLVVSLNPEKANVIYQNKKLDKDTIDVAVTLTNKSTYSLPATYNKSVLFDKNGVPKSTESITLQSLAFVLENINLAINGGSTPRGVKLEYGGSWTTNLKIKINNQYKPQAVSEKLSLRVRATADTDRSKKALTSQETYFNISVGNIDKQNEEAKNNQSNREEIAANPEIETDINKLGSSFKSAVILPPDLEKLIGRADQINRLRDLTTIWVSGITNEPQADESWDKKLAEKAIAAMKKQWKKAFDYDFPKYNYFSEALSQLGFTFTAVNSTIRIRVQTEKYGERLISLTFSGNGYGAEKVSSAEGSFTWQVEGDNLESIPPSYREGSGGMALSYDLSTFANDLYSIEKKAIKNFYAEVIGHDIDKLADELFGKFLMKIITKKCGSLSDGIFNLMEKAAIYSKKSKFSCPVDVYVYDPDGKLCGSIVNNTEYPVTDGVHLYVEGDDKYVWYTGDDYTIHLVGTNTGTMTYVIEEYSDDQLIRTVTFQNVPLTDKKVYTASVLEEIYTAVGNYTLHSNDGAVLPASSDTYKPFVISSEKGEAPVITSLTLKIVDNKAIFSAAATDSDSEIISILLNYAADTSEEILCLPMQLTGEIWTVSVDIPDKASQIAAYAIAIDSSGNQSKYFHAAYDIKASIPDPDPDPKPDSKPDPNPGPSPSRPSNTISKNEGGSSDGRTSIYTEGETEFWEDVLKRLETADGETVRINARSYDRLPWTVVKALRESGGILEIARDGKQTVRITAEDAEKLNKKVFYLLSSLAERFAAAEEPSASDEKAEKENPGTGAMPAAHPAGQ